jgi:glycosyltransferase involved in cell wall biosynthesis
MRVAVVTSIHPDYDARVFRHACSLAAAGMDVDLVCPWGLPAKPLPAGLRLVRFRRVEARLLRPILIPVRILRMLRSASYDVIHFHDLDLLPVFSAVSIFQRKTRFVYDCHENYSLEMQNKHYLPRWLRQPLGWIVKWGERLAALSIREVVIVVPSQEKTFPGPWFHPTLVQNFAELELERGRADDYDQRRDACISIAFQYVANGSLFLLDVARELVNRRPTVLFYAIDRFKGDDALRRRVLARRDQLGLQDSVTLLPSVLAQDIMKYLNMATIGLLLDLPVAHRIAALPMKLFEYMAAGLPVVGADLPNIRAIVASARCGILAEPGNVGSFADAICKLADDRCAARAMGFRGLLAFRERYNWDHEVRKVIDLYDAMRDLQGAGAVSVK